MHLVYLAVLGGEVGGDQICHDKFLASRINCHVTVTGGNQHHIACMRRDNNHISPVRFLEQIIGVSGKYFVDFRIGDSCRIFRVIVSFGFGIFAVDDTGRDSGDIVSQVMPFKPGMVSVRLVQVPVHIVERCFRVLIRRADGKYIFHIRNGPDRRLRKPRRPYFVHTISCVLQL